MKRSWFDRKPGHKGFKKTGGTLRKTRAARRDVGQPKYRSTRECDYLFSTWIRNRDEWTCQRCDRAFAEDERDQLTCSHFINVRYSAARYAPDNCVALCNQPCHLDPKKGWEYKKPGAYRHFMFHRLGNERFGALVHLKRLYVSLEQAKAEFMEKLKGGRL